jgi:gamma-glutamyl-gamma-aminobutyrate hydrolase PuuD
MTKSRIYLVSSKGGENRLVRAATRHQSIMHVASSEFSSEVASQDDLIEALESGVKIENYRDDNQQTLELIDES